MATTDDDGAMRLDVHHESPVIEDGVSYWHFRRQTRFYTLSWPLSRWLGRHIDDYDVVHIHALFSFATVSAAFWAGRRGVPYIVRPLGTLNHWGMENRRPWLKQLSFRFVEKRILRGAEFVHYTSEQERLEASGLSLGGRSEIIANPVELSSGSPVRGTFRALHPQMAGGQMVLFLSRFDAKKGLDLLFAALARVLPEKPEVVLVLAGDGESVFVTHLQEECRRLNLDASVIWAGFLAGAEKQAALADADVFVLPSYSENFGISVVEAMAAGVPVVISDRVGIHKEVSVAEAGLVIPCEVVPLANAILRLLQDSHACLRMGQHGRALAQTRYSTDAITAQLVRLYEGVARARV